LNFEEIVLINSNFTLFIQFGSVAFRFTLNTLIICIIYIVGKTGCYSISDNWSCNKSNEFSWYYEKQTSDIVVRVLESKQCDELRGKFGIHPHEKLEQLN